MFKALYFTYDGQYSGNFGLMIAGFDEENISQSSAFSLNVNSERPSLLHRSILTGVNYDESPQFEIHLVSELPINEYQHRSIMRWLFDKRNYKKLTIHQNDFEDYSYNCIFTNVEITYVNSERHGYVVTVVTDSAYAYGNPKVYRITGDGSEKDISILVDSDIEDYVYPEVVFKPESHLNEIYSDNIYKAISIINTTDSAARETSFSYYDAANNPKGVKSGETITVDNELRIISSDIGTEKLSVFNKHWLRLKNGKNKLKIKINGTLKITCPSYIKIGF